MGLKKKMNCIIKMILNVIIHHAYLKNNKGNFQGRVTEYIKNKEFDSESIFYLCGNFDMIYDVQNLLKNKGFHPNSIFLRYIFNLYVIYILDFIFFNNLYIFFISTINLFYIHFL